MCTGLFYGAIAWCYFVLVFFYPLSIGITSLGEERAYLSTFNTFVRFAFVWFCLFPLPLGDWPAACDCGTPWTFLLLFLFVCVKTLRSSQPNGAMSSAVSLPNHTFTG